MRRRTLIAIAALAAACGSAQALGHASASPSTGAGFSAKVTNPWFPLRPGSVYRYRGVKDGKASTEVMTPTHRIRSIDGAKCIAVSDLLNIHGKLEERTTDYYTQDANGIWSPVLMLTARDAVEDRVAGLDNGADDYHVKPFAFAELLARLRALARRGEPERPSVLSVGDLTLDPATRAVRRGSAEIALAAKEFALLETFMRRPGEVLSRLHLLEHAWDFAYDARSNVVDVHVRRLRRKIDEPFGRRSLETVRGAGYRLRAET